MALACYVDMMNTLIRVYEIAEAEPGMCLRYGCQRVPTRELCYEERAPDERANPVYISFYACTDHCEQRLHTTKAVPVPMVQQMGEA